MSTILKIIIIIIIIICERGAILKKKIGEREKQELVSKNSQLSGYFTKADDGGPLSKNPIGISVIL